MTTPHLTDADVRARLTYEALIPAMARALAAYTSGEAVQPVRTTIPVADHGGFLFVMPAYAGALGAKLVSYYPRNTGIETHFATIQLFNPATGEPLASMDGTLITEMRTAAVSAVATDRLARADAAVLAILGAGVQARSHLAALRHVRAFREVRVWSPNSATRFAAEHGVTAAASAEACVRGAEHEIGRNHILHRHAQRLEPGHLAGRCAPTMTTEQHLADLGVDAPGRHHVARLHLRAGA